MAIKSVSSWPHTRADIDTMINWTADKLRALGVQLELADLGKQTLHDGSVLPLPKVILGTLGTVSFKMTNKINTIIYGGSLSMSRD